jgi:uncharacterized membrane protein YwaF
VVLCIACRRNPARARTIRLILGYGLAIDEIVWWVFRYSHEGIHRWNLPLQLCDATVWAAVIACVMPVRRRRGVPVFRRSRGRGHGLC